MNPLPTKQKEILEMLEGFVDGIRGGVIYLTLKAPEGDLWGEVAVEKYPDLREHRRFVCYVYDDGEIELLRIPDIEISPERQAQLHKELEAMFPDGDPQDDY